MKRTLFFIVCFVSFVTYGMASKLSKVNLGHIKLPGVGSSFTYLTEALGDKAATILLWQEPGKRYEVHTYKGIVTGVKGKVKGHTINNSQPYNCLKWVVSRPDNKAFLADFYYAFKENGIHIYLEELSTGGSAYYVKPLKVLSFPLIPGAFFCEKTSVYLNIPDTGITLSRSYESRNANTDTIKAEIKISNAQNVTVPAGTFRCYKSTATFVIHTGRLLTSAKTTINMERWWSSKLKYFVKERNTIFMDALIDSKGTIEKELFSYNLIINPKEILQDF